MQESDLFGPKMAFRTDVSHYDVVESLLKIVNWLKTTRPIAPIFSMKLIYNNYLHPRLDHGSWMNYHFFVHNQALHHTQSCSSDIYVHMRHRTIRLDKTSSNLCRTNQVDMLIVDLLHIFNSYDAGISYVFYISMLTC